MNRWDEISTSKELSVNFGIEKEGKDLQDLQDFGPEVNLKNTFKKGFTCTRREVDHKNTKSNWERAGPVDRGSKEKVNETN